MWLCCCQNKRGSALVKILAKLFSLCDSAALYILLGEVSTFGLELNLIAGPSFQVLGWIGAPNGFPDERCLPRAGVPLVCIRGIVIDKSTTYG